MSQFRWEVGKQLSILVVLLFLFWFIGIAFDFVVPMIILVFSSFIFWHGRQFFILYNWLLSGRKQPVPEGIGPWYPVSEELHRWRLDSRQNKKHLLSVINEFRMSTDALADAVVLLDPNASIIWCNKASYPLLGFSKKKDVGTRITHLLRHPEFIKYLDENDFSEALTIVSPISHEMWISLQITPYLQGQKLLVARDITRLYRLEQVRQDFVANVSHELRTPLTVINGYLEILEDKNEIDMQQFRPIIVQMLAQGKRMKHIVEELLFLARMEKGLQIKSQNSIDMPLLLSQLKQEAQALSATQNHQIELKIESHKGLYANEQEIHKIFCNLVFNAVRYTDPNKKIIIRWFTDPQGGHFSVIDEGIGIAAQDISRLTERFYRVDQGRARDEGGTGLGLAIVKHTLERYRAILEITSELNVGSTFSCHFPSDWVEST